MQQLVKWTYPKNYIGEHWDNYYVFLSRTRDSDSLENSNFEKGLELIGGETGFDDDGTAMVTVVTENHWAVGWVEWIAIHETNTEALAKAEEIVDKLNDYPVLDEDDYSRREFDEYEATCNEIIHDLENELDIERFTDDQHDLLREEIMDHLFSTGGNWGGNWFEKIKQFALELPTSINEVK